MGKYKNYSGPEPESLPTQAIGNTVNLVKKYPGLCQMYPAIVGETGRPNEKRPGYMVLLVPDEVVQNIRNGPDSCDNYALLRVGRKVQDLEQSKLILPPSVRE